VFRIHSSAVETLLLQAFETVLSSHIPWSHVITVVDLGGVRGVQMHPPLAACNVFLRT